MHWVQYKQRLYYAAKAAGIEVKWRSRLAELEDALVMHRSKHKAASKLIRTIDERYLKTINSYGEADVNVYRLNRLLNRVNVPADKYLWITLKDEHNRDLKSAKYTHKLAQTPDTLYITEKASYTSDPQEDIDFTDARTATLQWINEPKGHKQKHSEFFRYVTTANYLLTAFQVYYREITILDSYKDEPCFLRALYIAGAPEDVIHHIASEMFTTGASHQFIHQTAKQHNICITLKTYGEDSERTRSNTHIFGDKSNPTYHLGCVGQHIFAIRSTQVTTHAINHPEFKEHPNFPTITVDHNLVMKEKPTKTLDSYEVISRLYAARNRELRPVLQPVTLANAPFMLNAKYAEVKRLPRSSFRDNHFQELGLESMHGCPPFIKKKQPIPFKTVYFDIETHEDNGMLQPRCICWAEVGWSTIKCAYGLDCISVFIESLDKYEHYLMWAHNLGFDARFVIPYLTQFNRGVIESGNSLKQLRAKYKTVSLVFKDTKAFINAALAQFPTMFPNAVDGITLEKESFPHCVVTRSNFNKPIALSEIYESFLEKGYSNIPEELQPIQAIEVKAKAELEQLIRNANAVGAIQDGYLDNVKYTIHYCKRDVAVLMHCFEAFRRMMLERFQQDVYSFISIPSLAYAILNNEGCFKGCFNMSGPALMFARQAICGGRVMTRDNEKHHFVAEDGNVMLDLDANSLYPTAETRIKGFPRGRPKHFQTKVPHSADYYIARVKVIRVNKRLAFPLQSYKDDLGCRNYTNDLEGRVLVLGKTALEDFMRFQQAEVETLEGIYWDKGFNDQIRATMKMLYAERMQLKAQKNPLQNCIKLLMNSSYGKLIQKPILKQKKLIRGAAAIKRYTAKNICKLITRTTVTDNVSLFEERKALGCYSSPAHLGVQILDMSKHIMNEVMCLAEEVGAKIYYQDTDSMHIESRNVEKLKSEYERVYGRELVGKELGQFSSDFEHDDLSGDIVAIESWFLGKKSYLDVLSGEDGKVALQVRMKGVPKTCIVAPIRQFTRMYAGQEESFDLSLACPIAINNKSQKVAKRVKFIRKISF